jgi:predicted PurR-regulated permease PerM
MTDAPESPRPTPAATKPSRRHQRGDGWRNADVLRATGLVIGVYLLIRLVWVANPLFFTVFLGVLFGLAVASGVDRLQRFRIPRGLGAAIIVLLFFGILFGFAAWMAPTIRMQAAELRHRLPEALEQAEAWGRSHQNGAIGMLVEGVLDGDTARQRPAADTAAAAPRPAPRDSVGPPVSKAANDSSTIASTLRDRFGGQFAGLRRMLFPFITSTIEVVGGFLLIVFLSIYIAADPTLYHRGLMALFPRPRRERAGEVLSAIANVLRRWLITQLIAMATIGTVSTVVFLSLGVKAAFALGLLAGLLEFIPTVGPILSAVPAVAMAFLDSPEKAIIVAGACFMIQFLENHLLIPLLMKGGVDIPPALTIVSQALMALVFGFLGLMVAVPLLAAVLVAVRMLYVEGVVGERKLTPGETPGPSVA